MARTMFSLVMALTIAACSSDRVSSVQPQIASPDTFAGSWRSVTPTMEFIRLTVSSKSSEQGVFASRLTYSGLAWEGEGRIDGDSLVVELFVRGASQLPTKLVLRSGENESLRARHDISGANGLELTLVRED